MKAPKGRNVIACGIATGVDASLFIKALKGRNIYLALSGLNEITQRRFLWRVPQAITLRSVGAYE